ncbi:hypothetical protein HYY71_06060 [Candidatus Woesearchaeota archaeon]|nr:hypothetical protein [Candidatus Woesearchaeota archaeon]
MLNGLSRLVEYFTLPREEVVNRGIRRRKTDELKRYCLEQNLGFYPEEVSKIPTFAGEVNRFIEERARRDLPLEQFTGQVTPRDLRTLVEIGGVLGYNGVLHEIAYSSQDTENVRRLVPLPTDTDKIVPEDVWVQMYGGNFGVRRIIETSTLVVMDRTALDIADIIIDWHSHPVGHGELGREDMHRINENIRDFGNKKVYFVLFQPNRNQAYWYQFKKAQP